MSGHTTSFTPAQLAAITARGGNLLVSAGAGSGKTRVLVERLLRYISGDEDGCGHHRFPDHHLYPSRLPMSCGLRSWTPFLKSWRPSRTTGVLRRQAALCMDARIGTIHGFCADVLRENAQLCGLSPDFRVADESEATLLRDKVLDELLDKRYETIGETRDFALLVDTHVGRARRYKAEADCPGRLREAPKPCRPRKVDHGTVRRAGGGGTVRRVRDNLGQGPHGGCVTESSLLAHCPCAASRPK